MMKLLKKLRNSKRGFSLVELIVVIAIMAVIAVILIPSLLRYVEDSRAEKDIKTTDELVTAVELALADQDIYDELVEHSVWDNVSCYVDKDSESGFEKTIIKETYNGNAEQYKFDDDARQNDEVPYYGAGNMRGLTITLSPTKDSNESTYELSRAIINRFVGRKTGYLYECEKLYNNVRSIVGDKIQNSSQTYRNSDFTIFIRLGSAGGNEAGNQDATQVWGQYNGTNLPADTVQTAKITTDRVVGDAGQYDQAVNDYINDETNTDIDFSKLAEMGGSNFGSTLDKEETLAAGLYDAENNLICDWNKLVNTYGVDVEKNYLNYETGDVTEEVYNGNYPAAILMTNENLQNGVKLVIGDVNKIGALAFLNCGSLESIVIPNSVTDIGEGAFCQCVNLKTTNISNSITSIKFQTFAYCENLTSINIPNSVKEIGLGAFQGCVNLESVNIPNSVKDIGEGAFSDCRSLTSIDIPNSVTSIGKGAFSYSGLTSIKIPNSFKSIGSSAFARCENLTSIDIPNSVTSIGKYAFEDCKSLTSITIPNSVTSIGEGAFYDCINLTSITIPDTITVINDSTFINCISLTSINIPNSVTSIGKDVFVCCYDLKSIKIPNSVASIGEGAFNYCSNLTIYYSGQATGSPWGADNATIKPYSEAPAELLP